MSKDFNFREYIEDKWRGKTVVKPFCGEDIVVENICDLAFHHLDLEDQRLALRPDIGWAYAFGNKGRQDSDFFKGFLFRPTQREAWWWQGKYVGLFGGMGSAKTLLGCLKLVDKCVRYPGTRVLIVRNTYPQLQKTTIETLRTKVFGHFEWQEGVHYRHFEQKKKFELYVGGEVSTIFYMSVKNDKGTVDSLIEDLKSLEVDSIMIDEPVQIDERVYQALDARVGRWGWITDEADRQMLVVGNPPPEGHYLHQLYDKKIKSDKTPIEDPERYFCRYVPTIENRGSLSSDNIRTLSQYPENMRKTFFLGLPGFVDYQGSAVFQDNFVFNLHVEKYTIQPQQFEVAYRGWDISSDGRWKACVVGQFIHGRLCIFHELLTSDPGIQQFIDRVKTECTVKFPYLRTWYDYVDPASDTKTETDLKSAKDIMRQSGIGAINGDKPFSVRKDAVSKFLIKLVDGRPGLLIDPSCKNLIAGFQGGYQYKVIDINTGMYGDKPQKNEFSHLQDALQYLCTKVGDHGPETSKEFVAEVKVRNQPNIDRMIRANPDLTSRKKLSEYTRIKTH